MSQIILVSMGSMLTIAPSSRWTSNIGVLPLLLCRLLWPLNCLLQHGHRIIPESKYLAHFVQYLRPNAYGLGEGKHGYASLSHRFLHGGIHWKLGSACYNVASTKG